MTALANDLALLALTHFASTLKDGSSLIAERETKLDNKALVRSNAGLAERQRGSLVSIGFVGRGMRAEASLTLFRSVVGRIVTIHESPPWRSVEGKDSDRT